MGQKLLKVDTKYDDPINIFVSHRTSEDRYAIKQKPIQNGHIHMACQNIAIFLIEKPWIKGTAVSETPL